MRSVFKTAVAALLAILLLGCAVTDTEHDDRLKKDQRTAEAAINKQVIPKLLGALPPEQRVPLEPLRAEVTSSIDAARIALEDDARRGSRLVVTTSFLAAQNALLEGSVIASATTGHERQLVDYSIMIARSAVAGTHVESTQYTKPFWQYIGWTAEQNEVFTSDPRFEALRQRALMQSLAWLVATLMNERPYAHGVETEFDSLQVENSTRQRTADLLVRAQIAPIPAWPVAILFSAIREPDEHASDRWICAARNVLETAVVAAGKHDFATNDRISIESRDASIRRWHATSQTLDGVAECDLPRSGSGSNRSSQHSP